MGTTGTSEERPARNRLGEELSPYLRQHAHNPVDWFPWGEEALERARRQDRPILLSIGYSACHWCHVMEHESFDDPDIAASMNEHFVSIKVDREERPDLDQIYQTVVQLMGRHGGWPLTVFLTPSLQPFFAGTYFPPTDRYGMPGFPTVLRAIVDAWENRRTELERSAAELTDAVGKVASIQGSPEDPPRDVLKRASHDLEGRFDEQHGGFGTAPKFPGTMSLDVLLRAWRRHGDEDALRRVRRALDGMREGGIHDQLGGGFHRYSVDERWLIPHFEKMLYDNALLARLYADGWRATGEDAYADTARSTLDYVLREMRSAEGGFYSSQDADSEGQEGKFFVWTPEQLREVLGEDDARIAALYWGVEEGGNFEHGTSVLHVTRSVAALAEQASLDEAQAREALERIRAKLFEAREQRVKPFRDEKVIASWNGLMIGAFADVGGALDEVRFTEAARESLGFVRETLWDTEHGRLLRIYKDGRARVDAFLEDYADLANAALDVYEATMDEEALGFATELVEAMNERFWDEEAGAFWFGPADRQDVLVRTRESVDNAVPSGTSSTCHALLRLHALTDDAKLLERAERAMGGLVRIACDNPFGFSHLIGAMDRYVHGPTEVVVVARADDEEAGALLRQARGRYVPNRVLSRVDPDAPEDATGPASRLGGRRQQDDRATAYVCRERTCSAPVTDPAALSELLDAASP